MLLILFFSFILSQDIDSLVIAIEKDSTFEAYSVTQSQVKDSLIKDDSLDTLDFNKAFFIPCLLYTSDAADE